MKKSHVIFLSMGSNVSPRNKYMQTALLQLKDNKNLEIIQESKVLENPALLFTDQKDFLNQVLFGKCQFTPVELLNFLQDTEKKTGRKVRFKNGPREIDLDILCYDHIQIQNDQLQLPHPGLHDRLYLHELLEELGARFENNPVPGIYFRNERRFKNELC